MIEWFVNTLRSYPEIAIFLSLALGYYFGYFTYKGLGLGAVTATLIAAVIIGQLGITVSGPLKPFFFLMFLFAIGYGVGPQFVRGIAQDGLPQAVQQELADRYAELFAIFYGKRDKIDRVTLWGVHDGMSWKNGYPVPGRTNYPLLFDRARRPKPALRAVLSVPRAQ